MKIKSNKWYNDPTDINNKPTNQPTKNIESTKKQTAKQTLKKKENCWDQHIDLCVFKLSTYFEFALELPAF